MSSSADDLFDSDNDEEEEEVVVAEMQPSGGAVSPASGEQPEEPQVASDEGADANVGADAPGRLVLQVTMPELTRLS